MLFPDAEVDGEANVEKVERWQNQITVRGEWSIGAECFVG